MRAPAAVVVRPVRWGVLGAANIAVKTVIPAMQGSPLTPVLAVASRTLEKAAAVARQLDIARAYGSYEELLADPDIDAIYNPLPNHLHVPWSVKAADAGKHVLCEKPIALSAAQARELLAARDRNGVVIGEAFMVRAHPRWHRVKALVDSGRIGELRLILGHFSYYRRDPDDVRSHVEWGGGVLLDIGCYPITLSRWLFDAEPHEVIGVIERDPDMTIDRLTSGLLTFASGQASFTCGGQLVLHQRMEILGTRGRIDVDIPFNAPVDRPTRIRIDDGRDLTGGGIETIDVPPANQYTLQGEQFARAVRGLGDVPVTVEDAIGNMAVIDALFRSAETGRWERPLGAMGRIDENENGE
ncbi:MAG: Gfo/Idh/MocA family protein [Gemmatimonadaceae bacterium]